MQCTSLFSSAECVVPQLLLGKQLQLLMHCWLCCCRFMVHRTTPHHTGGPPVAAAVPLHVEAVPVAACGVGIWYKGWVHGYGVHVVGVDGRAVAVALPIAGHRDLQRQLQGQAETAAGLRA
jgi:hypothetical protein